MSTHKCPGGCGADVANHLFACRADWFALPYALRQAIIATYRSDPLAHLRAMADAREWYREAAP